MDLGKLGTRPDPTRPNPTQKYHVRIQLYRIWVFISTRFLSGSVQVRVLKDLALKDPNLKII